MAPALTITNDDVAVTNGHTAEMKQLSGDEKAKFTRQNAVDRPLDEFTYGPHPLSGPQTQPVKQFRYPRFESKEAERDFVKLHMAVALRWLGHTGYANEG